MDNNTSPPIRVSVHGPDVTIDSALQVADSIREAFAMTALSMGFSEEEARCSILKVTFRCDGCGLERSDRPGPDEGWSFADNDDFCPACTKARAGA